MLIEKAMMNKGDTALIYAIKQGNMRAEKSHDAD